MSPFPGSAYPSRATDSLTAFESVIHMGEETRDAKRAVPRAVFWSVATNVVLGLVMIITFGVSCTILQPYSLAVYHYPLLLHQNSYQRGRLTL